jgi:cbb3-type cytochrome oxidase subunit 3
VVSDLLEWLDYSRCGEIALVMFCLIFAGVAWRAYWMSPEEVDECRSIPFDDGA